DGEAAASVVQVVSDPAAAHADEIGLTVSVDVGQKHFFWRGHRGRPRLRGRSVFPATEAVPYLQVVLAVIEFFLYEIEHPISVEVDELQTAAAQRDADRQRRHRPLRQIGA